MLQSDLLQRKKTKQNVTKIATQHSSDRKKNVEERSGTERSIPKMAKRRKFDRDCNAE